MYAQYVWIVDLYKMIFEVWNFIWRGTDRARDEYMRDGDGSVCYKKGLKIDQTFYNFCLTIYL